MANINDTYYSVLSSYSGSVNDKRSARLTEYLGYAKPMTINDMEKTALTALGHSGSLNDAWDSYLKSIGGSGIQAKADLLSSTFYGNPVPGLFTASEPGTWYDPSDVANTNWRYNLLTFTEQFDNAAWVKSSVSVSANTGTAPDGTLTADLVDYSAGGYVNGSGTVLASATSTFSIYAKAGTSTTSFRIREANYFGTNSIFNLTTGTVVSGSGTIVSVGNGWYRCSLSVSYGVAQTVGSFVFDNTSTGSFYIWGAQLELSTSSTASPYQRISDVNTEVMERFPKATLFQDSAGATPVTAAGQTVGLMLDKSQGLVLGNELTTNGDFSTDSVWLKEPGWSISGGKATKVAGTDASIYQSAAAMVQGLTYLISFTVSNYSAGSLFPFCRGTLGVSVSANGTYTQRIVAGAASAYAINFYAPSAFAGSIDNISVKLLAGNHATQATSTQRPTYGINPITGTRNLLTFSEQFDNAAWTKMNTTITANAVTAPDGNITADRLVETAASSAHYVVATNTAIATSATISFYAKADTRNFAMVFLNYTAGSAAWFNLSNGTVGSKQSNVTSTNITPVGNGWYRCAVNFASVAANDVCIGVSSGDGVFDYSGNGTSGIYIWGAQLETGSTATAYQKVVSQYEVTQAGVQSASYLAFDGVDDGMVTNTITPNIDKVQVFAGVRKLSDAAAGTLAETSVSPLVNAGAILFRAPFSATAGYGFASTGSTASQATISTGFAAPITNVLTGIGDIAGDTATLRVNGTQVVTSSTDQGTGNYLAYPLYIGRRAGTSVPLNGRIYSLITRFGANLTAGQITSTESWVNAKTGAY